MADAMLEVGARVDASGVQAGMQQASQAVQTGTAQMSASFATVNAASANVGGSLGNLAGAARGMVVSISSAGGSAADGAQNMRLFGQSLEGAASSGGHLTQGSRAISGAFMELEGRIPIRAVERFVATSETLGPILTAAFPVIGAIALGAALVHLGEEAYHAYQNVVELREGIQGLNQMEISVGRFVSTQADETERHIEDILTKTQGRAAALQQKLSYDQNKGTDLSQYFYSKEIKDLPDDVKGNYESMYKNVAPADVPDRLKKITAEVGNLKQALIFNQDSGTGQAVTKVGDFGANGDRDPVAYMQARLQMAQQIKAELSAASDNRASGLQATQTDQGAAVEKEAEERQRKAEEASRKGAEAVRKADEAKFKAMEAGRTAEEQQGKLGAAADGAYWTQRIGKFTEGSQQYQTISTKILADRAKLAQNAGQLSTEQTRGDEIQAKNTETLALAGVQLDLASGKITKFAADQRNAAIQADAYTSKLLALYAAMDDVANAKDLSPEEKSTKTAGLQNQASEVVGQQQAAALNDEARAQREATQEKQRAAEAQERLNAEVTKGVEIQAKNAENLRLAQVSAAEASGSISRLGAAQAEAAIHTQEHIDKVLALLADLDDLQQASKGLAPGSAAANQNAQQQQGVQNQLSQEQGSQATQGAKDTNTIATQMAAPYKQATQQIGTDLNGALAGWEKGQQTFGQAWEKVLGGMVMSLQRSVIQMGVQWIQHYAQQRALAAASATEQNAQQAATATAAKVASAGQAATQGQNAAITAAKNTYAATSGIPIIGPVLAPIAAGVAFAAVAALGMPSAAGGWDRVPADNTLANLHKNEMVLPSSLSDRIRNMTSNSSTTNNNFGGNTIHGKSNSFADDLDEHEDKLADKMKQLKRDGKV